MTIKEVVITVSINLILYAKNTTLNVLVDLLLYNVHLLSLPSFWKIYLGCVRIMQMAAEKSGWMLKILNIIKGNAYIDQHFVLHLSALRNQISCSRISLTII